MPTEYTSDIYDGKDITGKEFILKCARAFGAAVMMRDEPLSKEIATVEPSRYYLEQVKSEKARLKEYKSMSLEEVQKTIDENYESDLVRYHTRIKEANELEARYRKVLAEVQAWDSPSDEHDELKKYAINQLEESIKFDCGTSYIKLPVKTEASEWLETMIAHSEKQIPYYENQWNEEVERTEGRNDWIRLLKESVK